MCFTVLGRMETRVLSLGWPLALAVVLAALRGDGDYLRLLNLMVLVAFALDFGVYPWLIRYQPRWLSIALGAVEFLLMLAAMRWLPLVHVRLPFAEALQFYAAAWLGAWLTTQAVLPLAWPRWAEDGGEFRDRPERARDDYGVPAPVVLLLLLALLFIGIFFTVAL